jgi:hypothetical protein
MLLAAIAGNCILSELLRFLAYALPHLISSALPHYFLSVKALAVEEGCVFLVRPEDMIRQPVFQKGADFF